MNHELIRLKLERQLNEELYEQFEGDIIQELIRDSKIEADKDYLRAGLEGHSYKISKTISPDLYNLCMDVQNKLSFKDKIDYYVVNDAEVNAFTRYKIEDKRNHIIVLNSGIIKMMDDDELKFIIGHEIGHLISKYSELHGIIEFVFPNYERMPVVFRNKIQLAARLSEITSDRYGFIASGNLDKCMSNFFKLSSGLNTDRVSFSPSSYLKEIEKSLEEMKKAPYESVYSHPDNQIRIKSIELFSKSDTYKAILKNKKIKEDKKLNKAMEDLLQLTFVMGGSALDSYRNDFIISGGYLMAVSDEEVSKSEIEEIIMILSNFTYFPEIRLSEMIRGDNNIVEIFNKSISYILEANPAEKYDMFEFLISIGLVDKKFERNEYEMLKDVGKGIFGLSSKEIAQIISSVISKKFYPSVVD